MEWYQKYVFKWKKQNKAKDRILNTSCYFYVRKRENTNKYVLILAKRNRNNQPKASNNNFKRLLRGSMGNLQANKHSLAYRKSILDKRNQDFLEKIADSNQEEGVYNMGPGKF